MDDHPPAHPAFHPGGAVIAAPVQSRAPFQAADAPFNARPPIPPTAAPGLLLMRPPFGRCGAGRGQHDLFDALRRSIPLVRGRVNPAIPGEQAGWMVKYPPMMGQTRRQLGVLGRMALQARVATEDAALHLIQPEHAAKFGGLARFACADNRGVGLEPAPTFSAAGTASPCMIRRSA